MVGGTAIIERIANRDSHHPLELGSYGNHDTQDHRSVMIYNHYMTIYGLMI